MGETDHTTYASLAPGSPVIVNLHSPREKLWGLVYDLNAAGIFLRGIDLNTFDEWTQVIVRGERNIGLNHVFLPMWRGGGVALDETLDDIQSLADRFQSRVGITVHEYLGL